MENSSEEVEYKTVREKLEAEIAPVAWKDLQIVFARVLIFRLFESDSHVI